MCIRDRFYADAYKAAVQIVGGEQYILSAVMHADKINRAMTEAPVSYTHLDVYKRQTVAMAKRRILSQRLLILAVAPLQAAFPSLILLVVSFEPLRKDVYKRQLCRSSPKK